MTGPLHPQNLRDGSEMHHVVDENKKKVENRFFGSTPSKWLLGIWSEVVRTGNTGACEPAETPDVKVTCGPFTFSQKIKKRMGGGTWFSLSFIRCHHSERRLSPLPRAARTVGSGPRPCVHTFSLTAFVLSALSARSGRERIRENRQNTKRSSRHLRPGDPG